MHVDVSIYKLRIKGECQFNYKIQLLTQSDRTFTGFTYIDVYINWDYVF